MFVLTLIVDEVIENDEMVEFDDFLVCLDMVISTSTTFFGVFSSPILIAVFTSKISLNRSKQLVLDFVDQINRARAY